MVNAISQIPPLAEFVPLIGRINPDFIFSTASDGMPEQILSLLKNIGNPPADLVELWEDYRYMCYTGTPSRQRTVYVLGVDRSTSGDTVRLLDIHVLLDVSWNDLRAAICSLRPIIGEDEAKILALSRFAAEHFSSPSLVATLSLDLARGYIRLQRRIASGQKPSYLWPYQIMWSVLVRSSPHSPELLQDIREFPFSIHDIRVDAEHCHNILQWIKVRIYGSTRTFTHLALPG
ncbi:hypothetical protein B0H14DRAFT_1628944 [Mycena olivaceomarginata]|nr:hypothetical protein B0H14DRAFT_1628944 [Mycena olivaceomarginata]